ncbi:MAG: hypothetical protein LBQ35_09590 [Spirochaetaceae bacterium]|jgi:hypothetical protein|nr:hypothetical protein [Spirochaetaceae bacterium]
MKLQAALGISLALFCSCAGEPAPLLVSPAPEPSPDRRFWFTRADGEELVIIGSAARRMNRDEALALALEDAARKAAIHDRVTGIIRRREIQQSGFMGFSSDTEMELISSQDYGAYLESLNYDPDTDVLERDNAVFVRARFPGIPGRGLAFTLSSGDPPGWTGAPPLFPGYLVGVGFSTAHRNLSDTVKASYDSAIFSIVEGLSSRVSVSQDDSNTGRASSYAARSSDARATLTGFYVLEIWIDPQTRAVWTLAVAQGQAD